ncbi:MAG TPA: diguanylate cyclase [Polyangiaceae bacterium]|nr:diguanylate cyclase [Polyangiaceae bacterium]
MSKSKTLVLIDPAVDTHNALADRLRMQGYIVSIAADPAEGARVALGDPPSAVIADLWMPSISGVQLCRLLKAEPATEHVPVILRGPDSPRNRFWAERAGASEYVVKGRMGDLVRALTRTMAAHAGDADFFTTFAGQDIRERIAAHLDAALFESVLAAEVRALGTCGAFDRLFDLFSQFVSRVLTYRWLAISTQQPARIGLHSNPTARTEAEAEARTALGFTDDALLLCVEDDDASAEPLAGKPIVRRIELGGILIGHLAIALPQAATAQDDDLATVVAREVAGPIRMATLVEESQRLATVDALTGLMNRRALISSLQIEVERSARYGHPLSLVLLDVDHFKLINDKRGHRTGDIVLAALGRLLHASARRTDITARWGGEEFLIVLTSSDASGAMVFAERLRRSIEQMVVADASGVAVSVSASIGLSAYEPGDTLDVLVDRADRAMYSAKLAGRNRVAVAESQTVKVLERPEAGEAENASAA